MLNPGIPKRIRRCPVLEGSGDTQETKDSARGAKSCDRDGKNAVGPEEVALILQEDTGPFRGGFQNRVISQSWK